MSSSRRCMALLWAAWALLGYAAWNTLTDVRKVLMSAHYYQQFPAARGQIDVFFYPTVALSIAAWWVVALCVWLVRAELWERRGEAAAGRVPAASSEATIWPPAPRP